MAAVRPSRSLITNFFAVAPASSRQDIIKDLFQKEEQRRKRERDSANEYLDEQVYLDCIFSKF
jgi:hypothetical protein